MSTKDKQEILEEFGNKMQDLVNAYYSEGLSRLEVMGALQMLATGIAMEVYSSVKIEK